MGQDCAAMKPATAIIFVRFAAQMARVPVQMMTKIIPVMNVLPF